MNICFQRPEWGVQNSVLPQRGAFLGILPFYQYESDACGGKNDEKGERERVKGNKPYTNTHIQVSFISTKAMHMV